MSSLLKILFAILAFAAVCSCNKDTTDKISGILSAADSAMASSPETVLEYLDGIDSTEIMHAGNRNLALYYLLKTEASYKCWLPVANDTAIDLSVSYFKRKGPDSKYARALSMKGAVYFEKGDFSTALESYMTAEQILSTGGDMLELGLINTRIAELYQMTFVNKSLAIERYRQALEYFKQTNLTDRIMFGNLSLARVMLFDSTDAALPYIREGTALAEVLKDDEMLLVGYELMTHYYDLKNDADNVIRVAEKALAKFSTDNETFKPVTESILICLIEAYAEKGMMQKATAKAVEIDTNTCDRQTYHYLKSILAAGKGDWKSAMEHERISGNIADSTMRAGFNIHLMEVEKNYENSRLKQEYTTLKSKAITYTLILSCVICLIAIAGLCIYTKNISLRHKIEKSTDIIRSLSNGRMESGSGCQQKSNARESIAISEEMLKVTDELLDAYYKYGRTKSIADHVKNILENHFPKENTMTRVRKIVDATYPGFLSSMEKEHPALKEKDIYIIALMACGFSTGTICALRRISESSLYVEKTRIAKKIGENIRLSDYIANALKSIKTS